MEDDLKKNENGRWPQFFWRPTKKWKTTSKKKKTTSKKRKKEDDLKINKNRRRPQAQFKKSALIGCDIIVN